MIDILHKIYLSTAGIDSKIPLSTITDFTPPPDLPVPSLSEMILTIFKLLYEHEDCKAKLESLFGSSGTRVAHFVIFEKLISAITSRMLRILMEHIDSIFSLEPEL